MCGVGASGEEPISLLLPVRYGLSIFQWIGTEIQLSYSLPLVLLSIRNKEQFVLLAPVLRSAVFTPPRFSCPNYLTFVSSWLIQGVQSLSICFSAFAAFCLSVAHQPGLRPCLARQLPMVDTRYNHPPSWPHPTTKLSHSLSILPHRLPLLLQGEAAISPRSNSYSAHSSSLLTCDLATEHVHHRLDLGPTSQFHSSGCTQYRE